MRMTLRNWGACLGVALLLLAAHDVRTGRGADGSTGAAWLGVYSQVLTSELREGLEYQGEGALVTRVVEDSPADRAGLRKGDVIVRVDTQPVDSPEALMRAIRGSRAGESVVVQVVRDGQRLRLNARLVSRPADQGEDQDEEGEPALDRPEVVPRAPDQQDDDFTIELPDGGTFSFPEMGRGRLGVRVESLNQDLGDYFGIKDGKGVLVLEVLKDTPAERAGIKAGDVITRVDGRAVYDGDDLVRALRSKEGKVDLTVMRRGTSRAVEAELAKAPRALRLRRGDGFMGWRDEGRGRVLVPGPGRQGLDRELKELRDEVRQLRRELEELKRR